MLTIPIRSHFYLDFNCWIFFNIQKKWYSTPYVWVQLTVVWAIKIFCCAVTPFIPFFTKWKVRMKFGHFNEKWSWLFFEIKNFILVWFQAFYKACCFLNIYISTCGTMVSFAMFHERRMQTMGKIFVQRETAYIVFHNDHNLDRMIGFRIIWCTIFQYLNICCWATACKNIPRFLHHESIILPTIKSRRIFKERYFIRSLCYDPFKLYIVYLVL